MQGIGDGATALEQLLDEARRVRPRGQSPAARRLQALDRVLSGQAQDAQAGAHALLDVISAVEQTLDISGGRDADFGHLGADPIRRLLGLEERAAAAVARRGHRLVVELGDEFGELLVELGQREELMMAQGREQPSIRLKYPIFCARFILGPSHTSGDYGGAVMLDQCGIADVDDGVVEGGVGDANLKIVDVLCPTALCG